MTHIILGKRKVAMIEETRRETKKMELQDDCFDPTLDTPRISNSRLENNPKVRDAKKPK